jgi:hypothetical protein
MIAQPAARSIRKVMQNLIVSRSIRSDAPK